MISKHNKQYLGGVLFFALMMCIIVVARYLWFYVDHKNRLSHLYYDTFFSHQPKDIRYLKEKFQFFVVCLTTSPRRISKIEGVINSIMSQTIVPNKIILNLPHIFKRDGSSYNIPDFIKNNPLIQINKCEDIGPATKIFPTALLFDDPETVIISIDDDIIYPPTMIQNLLDHSNDFPDSVISGFTDKYIKSEYNYHLKRRVFYGANVSGYIGVLYKSKFLNTFDQSELLTTSKSCYLSDDLIISNHLFKHNINIVVIFPLSNITECSYGVNFDALKMGAKNPDNVWNNLTSISFDNSNYKNYKECSSYLKDTNNLYITQWIH